MIYLPLVSKDKCSITWPMYCSVKKLDTFFNEAKNQYPIETLINSADDGSTSENKWAFDKNSLMIYNNKYWKGFFPIDQNFDAIRYFGGFWKRFYKEDGIIKGVTHPYEVPSVFAPNLPQIQENHKGLGQVIYLKYTSPEYSLFYDLLKLVDKNVVLGKAFLGVAPFSIQILNFSMSRNYSVDFMTEEDHQTIYQVYSRGPSANDVIGRWDGKLVSDSSLTPITQEFIYTKGNIGKLQMRYTFGGLLRGISKVVLTPDQMNMYDFTNWHDEVKIVKDGFMLGKWCSPWTKIPLTFGPSFLSVENGPEGSRFCLRFILNRKLKASASQKRSQRL
ncbi:MAG: hypothetical protein WAM27_10140 [Nitrososphaeraceae archaeon]